jgi:hypothetical protein
MASIRRTGVPIIALQYVGCDTCAVKAEIDRRACVSIVTTACNRCVYTAADGVTAVIGAWVVVIAIQGDLGNTEPINTAVVGRADVAVATSQCIHSVGAAAYRVTAIGCAWVFVIAGDQENILAFTLIALIVGRARVSIIAESRGRTV